MRIISKNVFFLILLLFSFCISNASIIILNGLSHNYKVEKGNKYKGFVRIMNSSDSSQGVKLFLNDYSYKASGEIFYSKPSDYNRSNVDWIDLSSNYLTLKPKQRYDLYFEITVPENIDISGSFWSVLIVEPVDDIKPSNDKEGIKVRSVVRYAIQIITTLEDDLAKANLEFQNVKVNKNDGKRILEIDIANTGELYHKVNLRTEIYSSVDGSETEIIKGNIQGLFPETSKRFYVDISKIQKGDYKLILLADCQNDLIFGQNIDLSITNE